MKLIGNCRASQNVVDRRLGCSAIGYRKAATLNDKTGFKAVEKGVVVPPRIDVGKKIRDGDWTFPVVQLNLDVAKNSPELDGGSSLDHANPYYICSYYNGSDYGNCPRQESLHLERVSGLEHPGKLWT